MNLHQWLIQPGHSQTALALRMGVSQSAVSQWLRTRVPAQRVLQLEALTAGQVSRHELRPDLYPATARGQA